MHINDNQETFESELLQISKTFSATRLLQHHNTERLKFARNQQKRDVEKWKKIVFSDESIFDFDDPDGYQQYWHDGFIPPKTF